MLIAHTLQKTIENHVEHAITATKISKAIGLEKKAPIMLKHWDPRQGNISPPQIIIGGHW